MTVPTLPTSGTILVFLQLWIERWGEVGRNRKYLLWYPWKKTEVLLSPFLKVLDRSSSLQDKIQLDNSSLKFHSAFHFSVSPRLSCVVVQHTWRGTSYSVFFPPLKLWGEDICLLRPRANGLKFQSLDLSPIFSLLCLLQFWKYILLHFLFPAHWCCHQGWIIPQTKQKEQDFRAQVF